MTPESRQGCGEMAARTESRAKQNRGHLSVPLDRSNTEEGPTRGQDFGTLPSRKNAEAIIRTLFRHSGKRWLGRKI